MEPNDVMSSGGDDTGAMSNPMPSSLGVAPNLDKSKQETPDKADNIINNPDGSVDEDKSADTSTWTNVPTVQDLKKDFDNSKSSHDTQMQDIQKWTDLMEVSGKYKPKVSKGMSSIQPKLIRRQAEWRYAALTEPFLGSDKLFKVSPATYGDVDAAKQNELVLNWQFRTKINRVKFIDEFVRTTVDEGTSIIRVGWDRYTNKVKETLPIFEYYGLSSQQEQQVFQQILQFRQSDPNLFFNTSPPEVQAAFEYYEETGQPNYAVKVGEEVTEVDKIIENKPIVELLDPNNVYIDPSCNGDLDKALFVVISFETNKAELLREPDRYSNLDKINFDEGNLNDPNHTTTTPDNYNLEDVNRRKVIAYEYWGYFDVYDNGILVPIVATWIGDTIIRLERNPYPDNKLPFVVVPYLPVKRSLYGQPDAELLEDNQKVLGAVTRGLLDLLGKSANAQQGFAKGILDGTNKKRFQEGEDYEFNPNIPVNMGFIEHKYPEFPQSAMYMLNMQNQEAEALTGVKAFSGGISGESYGEVAAGIRGALDAASKREMAILRRLAKGISDLGSKIIAMNSVFLSEKEVIRVTDNEFVNINREDLKGNFDLMVDISTAEVDNQKSQDLAFMLQTLGNTIDPKITYTILSKIADLKRIPDLAHTLANYTPPPPDPMEEQMKQLQMQNLSLNNQLLQSQIQLNGVKATEVNTKAQSNAVDTQLNASGVNQQRDLSNKLKLKNAEAHNKQMLEISKGINKPIKEGDTPPDIDTALGLARVSQDMNQGE